MNPIKVLNQGDKYSKKDLSISSSFNSVILIFKIWIKKNYLQNIRLNF